MIGINRKLSQIRMGRNPPVKLSQNILAENKSSAGKTYSGAYSSMMSSRCKEPGHSISKPQPTSRKQAPTTIHLSSCFCRQETNISHAVSITVIRLPASSDHPASKPNGAIRNTDGCFRVTNGSRNRHSQNPAHK